MNSKTGQKDFFLSLREFKLILDFTTRGRRGAIGFIIIQAILYLLFKCLLYPLAYMNIVSCKLLEIAHK